MEMVIFTFVGFQDFPQSSILLHYCLIANNEVQRLLTREFKKFPTQEGGVPKCVYVCECVSMYVCECECVSCS